MKTAHIIGVVLFFGSILGHAIAGIVSSASENPLVLNSVREVIQVETYYLTIPGLVLFTLTGLALLASGNLSITKIRWLLVHVFLGILVILNASLILLPTGQEILAISHAMLSGSSSVDRLQQLENREAIFGALNIIACLLLITLAVIKPKLGKK